VLIDSPDRAREWLDSWKGHSSYRWYLKYAIDGFRTNLKDYEVLGYTESAETTREILAVLEAAAAELEDCA